MKTFVDLQYMVYHRKAGGTWRELPMTDDGRPYPNLSIAMKAVHSLLSPVTPAIHATGEATAEVRIEILSVTH